MDGLLSFVVFAAMFYLMMRFGCGAHMMRGHGRHAHRDQPSLDATTTDPVCGMPVLSGDGYAGMHAGQEFRFCSKACLDRFETSPGQYIATDSGDHTTRTAA